MPGTRLHSDDPDAKEAFKKKMKLKEIEEQKKELEEKKKLLAKVRGRIETDKEERNEKFGNQEKQQKEKEENDDIKF
jgi:septal ring factor EnvC (AmiA/AmiB activator)